MACEAFELRDTAYPWQRDGRGLATSKVQSVEWQRLRRAHDPCLTNFFCYGQKRRVKPSASHRRCVDAAHALSGQLRIFGIERQRRYLTNRS